MENIIEINNLTFKYNNKNALFDGLNVNIEKGKITDIFNILCIIHFLQSLLLLP